MSQIGFMKGKQTMTQWVCHQGEHGSWYLVVKALQGIIVMPQCICLLLCVPDDCRQNILIAMQGAVKNEEWAGWDSAAAKEDKASHANDEWGKW